MNGMHCPTCREEGPDLVLDISAAPVPLPIGLSGEFQFRCENCLQSWHWSFTNTADGFTYSLIGAIDNLPLQ